MKIVIASLVAAAGLASVANAQALRYEVSTNGGASFSSSANALPGSQVIVRAVVSYTGTAAPVGLASVVFQPVVSNYGAGDSLAAFLGGTGPSGNQIAGSMATAGDYSAFGRVSPFGRTALSTSSYLRGHVSGSTLRIAQANVTSAIGGAGNTTGNGGVSIAQLSNVGRVASDPAFNDSLQNIEVFTFAITLGADPADRTLTIDTPEAGFGNRVSGAATVRWFTNLNESTGSTLTAATVGAASINVVPAPGALALMGLGGLVAGRRRR